MNLNALFNQPPTSAIDYLKQKNVLSSSDWQTVIGDAHNQSFVVAQMAHLDLLEDVRQSLVDSLEKGISYKDWAADIQKKMQAKGWWGKQFVTDSQGNTKSVQLGSPERLKTIYRTNMGQAYEAGRQADIWADETIEYVMYSAVMDSRTRPAHAALHGVVMRKDDPTWSSIAPKNGYRCRCTIIGLGTRDVKRGGYTVRNSKGFTWNEIVEVGHRSGNVRPLERTVIAFPDLPLFKTDLGWNTSPQTLMTKELLEKAAVADPALAAKVIMQSVAKPAVLEQVTKDFKAFAAPILDELAGGKGFARGNMVHVGALPVEVINGLNEKGITLESAVLSVRDEDVIHAFRDNKQNPVAQAWYLDLPTHLTKPDAVLLDTLKGDNSLIFVYSLSSDAQHKVVIRTDLPVKSRIDGEKVKFKTNIVRTAQIIGIDKLGADTYELLFGKHKGK